MKRSLWLSATGLFLLLCSCATTSTDHLDAVLAEGNAYLHGGDTEKAIATYDTGRQEDGELRYDILYNKIRALIEGDRMEEAIALCDQAFARYPAHLRFLEAKAHAQDALGRTDEAIRTYRLILEYNRGDYETHATLMDYAMDNGDERTAKEAALFLIDRGKNLEQAYTVMADIEGEESMYGRIASYLKQQREAVKEQEESPRDPMPESTPEDAPSETSEQE